MNDATRRAVLAFAAESPPSRPPDVDRALRRGMRTLRLRLLGVYAAVVVATAAVLVTGTALTTVARPGDTEAPSPVRSLEVLPGSLVLHPGEARPLTARAVTADDGAAVVADGVAWRSSDVGVVEVDPSSGRATGRSPGTATITAAHRGRSATAAITVVDPPPTLTELAVLPDGVVLDPGDRRQLTARATSSDGTTADVGDGVAWTIDDPGVARVDPSGRVTARSPGTTTVTATHGGLTADAVVTVDPRVTLTSLAVTPSATHLGPDEQRHLAARATFSDGRTTDVRDGVAWRTDDPEVAEVDPSGRVTARAPGTATVTATHRGLTADAVVTVDRPATLTSISVIPAAATLAPDEQRRLVVTASFSDGSTIDVRDGVDWTTDDPKVAGVDPTGLATAHTPGTAVLTATYAGLTADAAITVERPVTLTSVSVTPSAATLAPGGERQLVVTATSSDGSTSDVREGVAWASDDPEVAEVEPSGLATAHTQGTATVTATYAGLTGDAVIRVVVID